MLQREPRRSRVYGQEDIVAAIPAACPGYDVQLHPVLVQMFDEFGQRPAPCVDCRARRIGEGQPMQDESSCQGGAHSHAKLRVERTHRRLLPMYGWIRDAMGYSLPTAHRL